MDYSTWFYFKLNRIAHRDPIYSIKLFREEDSLFGGQVWGLNWRALGTENLSLIRLHSESWSRSDYIQVFCCLPTPHRLGAHWMHCWHYSLLILLINANLCKFLINFLLFQMVHFLIGMLNSDFLYLKDVARKCLIHSNYLVNVAKLWSEKYLRPFQGYTCGIVAS